MRRTVLQQERADAYERVFDAIIAEEVELAALSAEEAPWSRQRHPQ